MSDVRQLSGPQMAARMTRGTRVKRGADWCWGDQDGHGLGVVTKELDEEGWIRVEWNKSRRTMYYRMGYNDKYDLQLAEP